MKPKSGRLKRRRLQEVDSMPAARERILTMEEDLSDLVNKYASLRKVVSENSEIEEYDDTELKKKVTDLRYEFDRHEHKFPEGQDKYYDSREAIFTSQYDETADTYIVSWRDFYIWLSYWDALGPKVNRVWQRKLVEAGTLTWNAVTGVPSNYRIYIQPYLAYNTNFFAHGCDVKLAWGDSPTGIFTGADTATQDLEVDNAVYANGRIGPHIMSLVGTDVTGKAALDFEWSNYEEPIAECTFSYRESSRQILFYMFNYEAGGFTSTDNLATVRQYTLGTSFDDTIILGWTQAGDNVTVDKLANSGLYDQYVAVGYAKTDASGKLKAANIWNDHLRVQFGYTGTFTVNAGTNTAYVLNGRIYKVV